MNPTANAYTIAVILAGMAALAASLLRWPLVDLPQFCFYLLFAVIASCMKIRLPGLDATISPGFILLLIAAASLSWPEATLIAAVSGLAQSLWRPRTRPNARKVLFNAANMVISGSLANAAATTVASELHLASASLIPLLVALTVLYFVNVTAVSVVVCLLQGKPVETIWQLCNYYTFPAYAAGTFLAWLVLTLYAAGTLVSLLPLALIVPSYFFYRMWVQAGQASTAP